MKKIFSLLGLLMLLFSSGAWAKSTPFEISSTESAYVDVSDQNAAHSGKSLENLITYYTQERNWTQKNWKNTGTVKFNAGGKLAFYKFPLSALANAEGILKSAEVTITINSTGDGKNVTALGIFAYNGAQTWTSDLLYGDVENKGSLSLGYTVDYDGSFVLLDNEGNHTLGGKNAGDITVNVKTYLQSAIEAGWDYVTFAVANNSVRITNLSPSAKLNVVYATGVDYTINYLDGENVIETESSTEEVGSKVKAKTSLWNNDKTKKYFAANGAQTEFEITQGTNIFNVQLREADTFNYTVASNNVTLASGTGIEGENVTAVYPQFYLDGTTLYETVKTDESKKRYNITFALDQNNKVATVASSQKATGVVYYKEGEDIEGMSACSGANVAIRCSNGKAGTSAEPVTITKLPAGVYNIAVGEYDNSNSNHHTATFTVGDQTLEFATGAVNQNQKTFTDVILSSETDLIFGGVASASNGLDYIYIQKTADYVATEDLTINDAEITIGQNTQMTATLVPSNATNKTLTWTIKESNSINAGEAEIDAATGEITPLKAGLIAVEVTNGEKTDFKEFTIAAAQFDATITGVPESFENPVEVIVGEDKAENGETLFVSTKEGYDNMQNTSLLQPVGSVTATKIPRYIYSITVDKKNKTVDVVYEEDIEVEAMNFEVTDQRIAQGNSRTLQVTYSPADASFKTAKWTSSNPEVATVDENTGLVTAVGEGETTITAEWSENAEHEKNISAQMTLTVDKGLVLDRIVYDELDDATAEVMGYYHPLDGDTLFLPAYIESNGRMIPVSFIKQEAFIGSNPKSIVIPGTVKIIDHRAMMYSNTHNAYEELPEDGLESAFLMEGVEVMRDRIFHGNKYMKKVFLPSTLTDIGFYSFFDTAIEDVYFGGTEEQWNALKNLENAKLPETAKIHFNSDFTTAFINSIEVEEESVEIAVGETYAIEASIIPEEIAPVVALTYTSSNEAVATVDEDGVVTGIADGYVTITVSAGEGVEAKVRVKVGDPVQERENVLTMDFEEGDAADYWFKAIAESQLVDPTAEGSTGRAAAVVSGSDRGDYVKVNADLDGATKYEVAMDLLLTKSPKTTQFSVLNASSWDDWTTNWGMFWKDTKAQSHNPFLFNLDIAGNSNTANVNIDFDADGNAISAQQTWDFENGVWYTLTLAVDVNAHTVDYAIAPKSDLSAVAVSGTYTAPADEMMQIKGIYERNGRYNYSPGAIAIDNVIVDVTERGFVEGQGGNQATGINEAKAEKSVKNGKYVENGQIVIYIDGKKFNAAGQQMK